MLYVYIGCLTFGVIYSLISAVLGGHGFDHGGVDHAGAHGHASGDNADSPSPFNPMVIASTITVFGAVGIIGRLGFRLQEFISALIATGIALLVGAAIFYGVVKLIYRSQSNSTYSQDELVGINAEVITPLPENGMGEIAYIINGMRYNMAARAEHNEKISRGEVVRIKDIIGNIAVVTRKMTIEEYEMQQIREMESKRDEKDSNNNI